MTSGRARSGAAWLVLHFSLVILFALRDLVSLLPASSSWLPPQLNSFWRPAGAALSVSLGEKLSTGNPIRRLVAAYGDIAGIEGGYSYFAPSVPGNCKLLFELHYPGGQVEYDLPHVKGAAAGYRVSTLLDYLELFHLVPLREAILRPLVYESWRKHPDAESIRAIVAVANLPTMEAYRHGNVIKYEQSYAYDFRFRPRSADPSDQ